MIKKTPIEIGQLNEVFLTVPNIRNIPDNCKHLVNKDDVLYLVPGDGCCGPNCASAFLFQDEVYGPKLRRQMNIFFADHWYDRYQYVTQCSEDHPFVRKLGGGGEANYTDPQELIKYLKHSEDAAYMWSDSEDLSIIADMYQIRIRVITTKGKMDNKPTVNWIYPDATLVKFALLKNVKLDDMTILHENDIHFNLVVSKDSDLAKIGSLSYRFNIGPLNKSFDKETVEKDAVEVEIKENSETTDCIEYIKMKLKESEKGKEAILKEYLKCEKELRMKIEETEKLKTEIKDLKEITNLKEQMKEQNLDDDIIVDNEVNLENMKEIKTRTVPQSQFPTGKNSKKERI